MFKELITSMIDAGTLPILTQEEIEQLNKQANNHIVSFIVELEDEREYLDIKL